MQRSSFFSLISYSSIVLLLFIYVLFPSVYKNLSVALFSLVYTVHKPSSAIEVFTTAPQGSLRLQVVARPPQTPYDFLIATHPLDPIADSLVGHYVYTAYSIPIGYIKEQRKEQFIIVLFSSPVSEDHFSIKGAIGKGEGLGGGGIALFLPSTTEVYVDDQVIHQATGIPIGEVIAISKKPEKQIVRATSALPLSPISITSLYVFPYRKKRITAASLEALINTIHQNKDEEAEAITVTGEGDAL